MSVREVEMLFDAFATAGARMHAEDECRRKREQLASVQKRECGNCEHWMKSSDCPIDDQRKGFPSMGHPACGKFKLSYSAELMTKRFAAELSVLEARSLALARESKP